MQTRMNVVVIGCGWAGQIHAEACENHPETRLVAVCDPDLEKARFLGKRYHCQAYANVVDMLRKVRVQAAIVASPTETHLQVCQQFLEAGIPVLCEKPISRDSASARQLVADFYSQGLAFSVNYNRRFAAGYVLAKDRLASSGPVRFVSSILAQNVPLAQTTELRSHLPIDYLIFDALSHQFDLVHFLVGRPTKLTAFGNRENAGQLWTDIQVGVQFENGALGSLICSLCGPEWGQLPIERTEIGTNKERILIDNITARVEWFDYQERLSHQWVPGIFEISGYEESMRASTRAWLDAVLQNHPPPIPAQDGVLAIELCERVRDLLGNEE
jgi:predicted dehydrogenase